jgi:hypothetical protein
LASEVILNGMTGRQIGAVAGVLLAGIGCMKADRVVAIQTDGIDGGVPVWRPFAAPTAVAGLVAATTDVHRASLTSDELEIYFSCLLLGEANFHLWTSKRSAKDAAWSLATQVKEITGSSNDIDPDVSQDGLTLYFASDRSGAEYRLYVSQRTARDQPWGTLSEISQLTSSSLDRYGPSVDPGGRFLAIGSAQRNGNDYRLYSASRTDPLGTWGNVLDLSGINSGLEDNDPALFHDSRSLVWSSRGPSKGASWDLVEVSRPDLSTPFSSASMVTLDTLNTSFAERYPWVSQDGAHIMFNREPEGSPGVLYEAWRTNSP